MGRHRQVRWNGGGPFPRVVGDYPIFDDDFLPVRRSARKKAKLLKQKVTNAEAKFDQILKSLNGGVLKGKYFQQHVVNDRCILDFFFYEIRLGIEIDGGYHNTERQKKIDRHNEQICSDWDITIIRFKNEEVFRNRDRLVEKLRNGWREANQRSKNSAFKIKH